MEYIPILFKSIELKCPILSPVYYPNGITETQALKHAIIPKEPSKCDICGSEEGPRLAQVFFNYDIKHCKASIASVKFLCPLCKYAVNLDKVMELLVNSNSSSEEVDSLTRHFLLVNGHQPDDIALMEEIVSSCYSLKIVLKSLLSFDVDCTLC
ncbi:hypothetical protein JH06_1818 [Blastocystis sp. subtype 4]|uniref:hypothetical protein n=1 Tax=Blastocystis sp. subtype 4 TaxID=944170 RepID=UPI000711BA75|nr:hypothetical protein JH06_1818 [Blastocystis sp. subtype 4]KNB44566.1 hypothetical protein JH06_1818 [Blastocystis sp. subtype 4]|eukprot:XP_014528007.1 hypothetical protein JH06_1818 [Blastocystis sp. subtype 4]